MPELSKARQLRLRGGVDGVNWRPTRFVAANLHPYACSLCGVISGKTLLLPCAHSLCETCKSGSADSGTSAACPLDREAFDEDDCTRIALPAKKINALRAHCWNEGVGCPFVDTLPAVLRHYEEQCTFHSVQCPRCSASVQHVALAAHYTTGCHDSTKGPSQDEMPQADRSLGALDVNAAFEEFRALLKNACQDQFPTIGIKMNEITEQVANHGALLQQIVRTLTNTQATLSCGQTRVAELSTIIHELQSRLDALNSRCEGNSAAKYGEVDSRVPWHMEKKHILRKLEIVAGEMLVRLGDLREASVPYGECPVARCYPDRPSFCKGRANDTSCFSFIERPREHIFHRINLKHDFDSRSFKQALRGKVLEVILWHLKDVYFTVAIYVREADDTLEVRLRLAGTLETSSLESDILSVFLWDKDRKMNCLLAKTDEAAFSADPTAWQHVFWHSYSDLKKRGFFNGGELDFILDVLG